MGHFSPHCPNCLKNDMVEIYFDGISYHYDKYYCKRCKQIFKAGEGYPVATASTYQVTGGSVTWSGDFIIFSAEE